MTWLPLILAAAATLHPAVAARPAAPVILEPARDGQVVNGADVHMVTAPFDAGGHAHLCTDWEIAADGERVWASECARNAERLHTHLGDGVFQGTHAGLRELAGGAEYVLRVRHRDDSGEPETEWSDWTERAFRTSETLPSQPLRIRGLLDSTEPRWTIEPPEGATIRLEAVDGESMLEWRADGSRDERQLPSRSAVSVVIAAGQTALSIPDSDLTFEDENGRQRTIYLPPVDLEPLHSARFWVSQNGGTHPAGDDERAPNFAEIARGAPVPWTVRERGYVVEKVAGGFQLPVNLAFVPEPGPGPDDPLFYVAELYGSVQVVTRSGEVREFARNLLDVPPTGNFPGNGESGLAGITVDPESGDLFVTAVYWPDRSFWSLDPRVLRLRRSAGGLRAESVEMVKGFPGETQAPSHQISNVSIGPDRKLYVHVGDGAVPETAQDLASIRGKILRMNLDGTAPSDNPFYDERDGITSADYVYALGYRNPFGGAWRAADQSLYVVENGPSTDRLSRLVAGRNYLWDGGDESMQNYAACTWTSPAAPVQAAFVQKETFGGSGFPRAKLGSAFVTESGATYATGMQAVGKRISEVAFAGETVAGGAPVPFVEYDGTGKATVSGIAAGPDGLYFTDLYKDFDYRSPIDRGANVFRVRWTGYVLFDIRAVSPDGRTIHFVDTSRIDSASAWNWDFGDGTSSSEQSPRHEYAQEGTYVVRLHVTGPAGTLSRTKKIRVAGEAPPLQAEYAADGMDPVARADAALDFDWADASPDPRLPGDAFTAHWQGTLQPRFSETYRFTVESNDFVRVRVGGITVVDRLEDRNAPATGAVQLEAGRDYDVVVDYRHEEGRAALRVSWESASQLHAAVPRSFTLPRRRAVR